MVTQGSKQLVYGAGQRNVTEGTGQATWRSWRSPALVPGRGGLVIRAWLQPGDHLAQFLVVGAQVAPGSLDRTHVLIPGARRGRLLVGLPGSLHAGVAVDCFPPVGVLALLVYWVPPSD